MADEKKVYVSAGAMWHFCCEKCGATRGCLHFADCPLWAEGRLVSDGQCAYPIRPNGAKTLTLESARCIAANLNSLNRAAELVQNREQRGLLMVAIGNLSANLYADFYDVLPVIRGQKSWPEINPGDTWTLDGRVIPFNESELTQ